MVSGLVGVVGWLRELVMCVQWGSAKWTFACEWGAPNANMSAVWFGAAEEGCGNDGGEPGAGAAASVPVIIPVGMAGMRARLSNRS